MKFNLRTTLILLVIAGSISSHLLFAQSSGKAPRLVYDGKAVKQMTQATNQAAQNAKKANAAKSLSRPKATLMNSHGNVAFKETPQGGPQPLNPFNLLVSLGDFYGGQSDVVLYRFGSDGLATSFSEFGILNGFVDEFAALQ